MKMIFTPDEVCKIVRKHLVQDWSLPNDCIENVQFFTYNNGRVEATIKTAEKGGGPYRSKPQAKKPRPKPPKEVTP